MQTRNFDQNEVSLDSLNEGYPANLPVPSLVAHNKYFKKAVSVK